MSEPADLDRRIGALASIDPPDPARLQAFAERRFRFETPDGFVAATVNGGQELLELEVMVTATRGEARETLGAHVVEAVNGALTECAQARRTEFGISGDALAQLSAKTDAFVARMDRTAGELESLRRSLSDRLAQAQQLYRPGGTDPR